MSDQAIRSFWYERIDDEQSWQLWSHDCTKFGLVEVFSDAWQMPLAT